MTYNTDYQKNLKYRHYSTCCNSELEYKHYFNDKLITSEEANELIRAANKKGKPSRIQYIYHCTDCGNKDEGKWQFKHLRNIKELVDDL